MLPVGHNIVSQPSKQSVNTCFVSGFVWYPSPITGVCEMFTKLNCTYPSNNTDPVVRYKYEPKAITFEKTSMCQSYLIVTYVAL